MKKKGYQVSAVSGNQSPKKAAEHLYWVNIITSNLKRYLLSTHHGAHKKYRASYVAEFEYRLNQRFWPGQAFERLLNLALQAQPVLVG